MDDTYHAKLVI